MNARYRPGTITLCQVCHHAIQYRRIRIPYIEVFVWEHTDGHGAAWHDPEPMREVGYVYDWTQEGQA